MNLFQTEALKSFLSLSRFSSFLFKKKKKNSEYYHRIALDFIRLCNGRNIRKEMLGTVLIIRSHQYETIHNTSTKSFLQFFFVRFIFFSFHIYIFLSVDNSRIGLHKRFKQWPDQQWMKEGQTGMLEGGWGNWMINIVKNESKEW